MKFWCSLALVASLNLIAPLVSAQVVFGTNDAYMFEKQTSSIIEIGKLRLYESVGLSLVQGKGKNVVTIFATDNLGVGLFANYKKTNSFKIMPQQGGKPQFRLRNPVGIGLGLVYAFR